jgi:glycosyltransferase involved in cell wall biosynthesis
MNIAVDIKCLAKDNAGIARAVRSLLGELQRCDTVNHYFLFERRSSDFVPTASRWQKIQAPSRLPGLLWLMLRLPRLLRRYQIDCLWEPENILPAQFMPAHIQRVVTVHDCTFVHYPQSMRWWNRVTSRIFFQRSLTTAHQIVAVSEFTKRDIEKTFGPTAAPIVVAANGAPNWKLPPDYTPGQRGQHLLFVGSSEPRKNLITLLRALQILRDQGLCIPLRIVGPSGWKNSEVIAFIRTTGLDRQIAQTGHLNDAGLIKEYCSCKALVFPSVFEGFGLPVLEALATDTLVLTSRGTVMEEIGGRAVMLCDPTDVRAIAFKIKEIYALDFDRDDYLRHRTEVLGHYSWSAAAAKLVAVFKA